MLGIEDQRGIEHAHREWIRFPSVQGKQERVRKPRRFGVRRPGSAGMMPGEQHRGQGGDEPVGNRVLIAARTFRLERAERRATRTQDVHGVGIGREEPQDRVERLGQWPQRCQTLAIRLQCLPPRQLAIHEEIGHFLEARAFGQIH